MSISHLDPARSARLAASPSTAALDAGRRACLVAARAFGRAARYLRARSRRAEDRALLLAMNGYELNDLGIGRGDVERLTSGLCPSRRTP